MFSGTGFQTSVGLKNVLDTFYGSRSLLSEPFLSVISDLNRSQKHFGYLLSYGSRTLLPDPFLSVISDLNRSQKAFWIPSMVSGLCYLVHFHLLFQT